MTSEDLTPTIDPISNRNPIYRAITAWSQLRLPLKLSTMIIFFGLTIVGLYAFLSSTGRIAFIGNGGGPVPSAPATPPVTPPVSPSPPAPPPNCVSGVTSASISGACSTQGFYYVTYTCANGQSVKLGDGRSCYDIYAVADQARITCGNICTPYSPRPSIQPSKEPKPSPSIPPSLSPKPSFSPSLSPRPSPLASLLPSPSPSPSPSYWACIINCIFQEKGTYSYCRQKCTR